jgi:hypothetical protein
MDTHNVPPDLDVLKQVRDEQQRRTIRRRTGVYGLLAALVVVVAVVAVRAGVDSAEQALPGQPSSSTPVPGTEPIGTVTFDGSTCSIEITADRIETGLVILEVDNATGRPVMFDLYQLSEGYAVRAFAATIERDRRRAEPSFFPSETEVRYLSSDIIPANSSGHVIQHMLPGKHAIVCMEPYEGEVMDFRPFAIVGPIVVR